MSSSILSSVLWFIVAIGVLVTVHEFGHFWVARRLGVKVLRFSIGFGRPLLMWRGKDPDQVEYCIAAIPLGGYVKMLDEREADVPPADLPRAFNRQKLGVRFAVVAAGPIANFLFAIAAYWLMFGIGVTGFKPLIGGVEAQSRAAAAGLRAGQEILSVDGRSTPTWQGFVEKTLGATLKGDSVAMEVSEGGAVRPLVLSLEGLKLDDMTHGQLFDVIGIEPSRPELPPILNTITKDSPAERAGLRSGDRITSANGAAVRGWDDFVADIRSSPEKPVNLVVERAGNAMQIVVVPAKVSADGAEFGRIGASVQPADIDYAPFQAEERYGFFAGLEKAFIKTWDMTSLTLRMLGKMVTFEVSVKNLSGPISIAQYAGLSAQRGVARFLDFLAVVSISLGILNFLPIPLLDGGHLMYYCIELVKGRPVSEQAQVLGQQLGIAMLVGLMGLAFYNDLARLFG